jgi:hypothetical protein
VNLFDAVVTSVFRYGLGVWGVTCAQVGKLDDLFVEFIRWVFRLPTTTGKMGILANFARRCAKCDALFLATVQIAQGDTTKNKIWGSIVSDLGDGRLSSQWYEIVLAEIGKRGFREEVLQRGSSFVAERKIHALHFAQYCFHHHSNVTVGNSADVVRRRREFGIFPFLFSVPSYESRFLLSFLLHCWRFLDGGQCSNYPRICDDCDRENSSFHLLFECFMFEQLRENFAAETGRELTFDSLKECGREFCHELCKFGKDLFESIAELCLDS